MENSFLPLRWPSRQGRLRWPRRPSRCTARPRSSHEAASAAKACGRRGGHAGRLLSFVARGRRRRRSPSRPTVRARSRPLSFLARGWRRAPFLPLLRSMTRAAGEGRGRVYERRREPRVIKNDGARATARATARAPGMGRVYEWRHSDKMVI